MKTEKKKIIKHIFWAVLIIIFILAMIDNVQIYKIKEKDLLKNNIQILSSNMDVENEKDIKLIKKLNENDAKIYLYKVDNKYAVLGYAQSTLYKNYKLKEGVFDLKSNEEMYLQIQTPKKFHFFEISLEKGKENIKLDDSTKNNSRYFSSILTIGAIQLGAFLKKHKEKRKQENESTI